MRFSHLCSGVAVAATLAIVGCGETVIDSAKVEKFVDKIVTEQAGIQVKSVSCPKDPKAEKGATFKCAVTATDGTKGDAIATQTDSKGAVKVNAPFLHPSVVETEIAKQIKQQTKTSVSVQCPEIVVPKKNGKYECEATDGEKTRKVETTMTDTAGSFTFKLI
jgi:Domain of unknown function (DUF4333)